MPEPIKMTKKMVEETYDGAASSYDRVGPSIYSWFGTHLVEQMPLEPGMRVLDIATGTGAVMLPAARRVSPEGHVTGIDLSSGMLKEAEQNARTEGLTNVSFYKMDAEHLDFPEESFDAVTCAIALFLFPDTEAAFNEMYRVCKPGGYIGLSVFNKTPPLFTPSSVILYNQLMESGIELLNVPSQGSWDPEELNSFLSQFGFRSIKTHSKTYDIIYTSLDDVWTSHFFAAYRLTFLSMDEETSRRLRDEYLAKLRPLLQPDGLHTSVAIIYTLAQR